MCVWRGEEGYRKAAWDVLMGRTTTLGPACQSTACFDLLEGLNLGPCDGLSQRQRFWVLKFL